MVPVRVQLLWPDGIHQGGGQAGRCLGGDDTKEKVGTEEEANTKEEEEEKPVDTEAKDRMADDKEEDKLVDNIWWMLRWRMSWLTRVNPAADEQNKL